MNIDRESILHIMSTIKTMYQNYKFIICRKIPVGDDFNFDISLHLITLFVWKLKSRLDWAWSHQWPVLLRSFRLWLLGLCWLVSLLLLLFLFVFPHWWISCNMYCIHHEILLKAMNTKNSIIYIISIDIMSIIFMNH